MDEYQIPNVWICSLFNVHFLWICLLVFSIFGIKQPWSVQLFALILWHFHLYSAFQFDLASLMRQPIWVLACYFIFRFLLCLFYIVFASYFASSSFNTLFSMFIFFSSHVKEDDSSDGADSLFSLSLLLFQVSICHFPQLFLLAICHITESVLMILVRWQRKLNSVSNLCNFSNYFVFSNPRKCIHVEANEKL